VYQEDRSDLRWHSTVKGEGVTITDAAQARPSSEGASGQPRRIYRHDGTPFAASALYRELPRSFGQENIVFDEGTLRPGVRFLEDIKCLTEGSCRFIAMIAAPRSSTTSRRQLCGLESPVPAGRR
jgi:hypothetical protein